MNKSSPVAEGGCVPFQANADRRHQTHSQIFFQYLYIASFAEILQTSGFPTGDVPFNADLTAER